MIYEFGGFIWQVVFDLVGMVISIAIISLFIIMIVSIFQYFWRLNKKNKKLQNEFNNFDDYIHLYHLWMEKKIVVPKDSYLYGNFVKLQKANTQISKEDDRNGKKKD